MFENKFEKIDMNQVRMLTVYGHTDEFMSSFFGVGRSTWNAWKNKHPEFFDNLKKWKEVADTEVEKSLYERARGYTGKDQKVLATGEAITYEKSYPPDTTACIFWLKNRKREDWRDKIEHSVDANVNHDLKAKVEPMEVKERIELLLMDEELKNALQ